MFLFAFCFRLGSFTKKTYRKNGGFPRPVHTDPEVVSLCGSWALEEAMGRDIGRSAAPGGPGGEKRI